MHITTRADLPALLTHHGLTRLGVELGVAAGKYSEHLLRHAPIRRLYSIDAWAGDRGHDLRQADAATRRLSHFGARSIVLRARFEEALPLFDDAPLDFAYIDGYAHHGNQSGATLHDWWEIVRPGGILVGENKRLKMVREAPIAVSPAGQSGCIGQFLHTEPGGRSAALGRQFGRGRRRQ